MSSFIERRRPAITRDFMLRIVLAWVAIAVLLILTNLGAIIGHRFPDPDDTLRMVQVRDLIAGQGWFDPVQHRGGETAMHWSRIVDIPIAVVILALRGLIGTQAAELAAQIVVPLLTMFACLFLVGRIAWRVLGDEMAMFACLALAFSVPVIEQLRPMRIDHHGWQIALVLLALNGLIARSPRVGGWMIGGALATALSISVEQLPIAAVFMAVLAFRWIADRAERVWLVSAMQALAAVSLALFLATRGWATGVTCDQIAPVHLAVFAWGALVFTGASALEPRPRTWALAAMAAAAGGALAIVWQAAPQCTGGTFDMLEPISRELWYSRVSEGMPIWRQDLPKVLQIVLPPAIALIATIKLAGQSGGWLRRFWIEYAVLLGGAFALSIMVARAGSVAGALAAIPLGWQLREWLRGLRHRQRPLKKAMAYGAISVVLVPAAPALLLVSSAPGQARIEASARASVHGTCDISSRPATLAALPDGTALVPLDTASLVLLDTGHTVLATPHHRAPRMGAAISAFATDLATARAIVRREAVNYVAICPMLGEPHNYAHDAPRGLAARLLEGRAPAWLEPVPSKGDGWAVWRVRH